MAAPIAESAPRDPRVYLAAERTLLAWVRTGLALMGFGFVVARFGLFLRATEALHGLATPTPPLQGASQWVGIALVVLGVAVNAWAALAHRRVVARLDRGEPIRSSAGVLGIVVALVLAGLGLLLAAYLLAGATAA